MYLVDYSTSTAAGAGIENFWRALSEGKTSPIAVEDSGLLKNNKTPLPSYKIHLRADLATSLTHRQRLARKLKDCWDALPTPSFTAPPGIILASTKGFIEDVVWTDGVSTADTLTPLLDDFLVMTHLQPTRRAVVSNACSSVAASLKLAQAWMDAGTVKQVIVISADTVGEFVVRGFHSLQALTTAERATPFDQSRAGLQLGEAAAILVLSRERTSDLQLRGTGLNCEGVAATRPDEEGRSLYLALSEVMRDRDKPSLIVAHGTATPLNDSTEDFVFHALYGDHLAKTQITGTKWCVGHTLGVSAALDLVAAAEILKNRKTFALPFTKKIDAKFKGTYVLKSGAFEGTSVLISSLGFGGVHAGMYLSRESV